MQQILSTFKSRPPSFNSMESDDVLKRIQVKLKDHTADLKEKGNTAQLWLQYFSLVTVKLHFTEAERMETWDLHLDCIRAMLHIFYASGHNTVRQILPALSPRHGFASSQHAIQ